MHAREASMDLGRLNLRWVFKRRYKNKPDKHIPNENMAQKYEKFAFCYSSIRHSTQKFILAPENIVFSQKKSPAKLRHTC